MSLITDLFNAIRGLVDGGQGRRQEKKFQGMYGAYDKPFGYGDSGGPDTSGLGLADRAFGIGYGGYKGFDVPKGGEYSFGPTASYTPSFGDQRFGNYEFGDYGLGGSQPSPNLGTGTYNSTGKGSFGGYGFGSGGGLSSGIGGEKLTFRDDGYMKKFK